MKITNTYYSRILTLVLCVLLLLSYLCVVPQSAIVYADDSPTVFDDFSGTDFNISDYPIKVNDYSLNVIQIAETDNGGLVVYVYQPSGINELRATSINIATDVLARCNYGLIYLGNYDTIYKYKVQSLVVSTNNKRRYDITSVYRAWNSDVDVISDNENTVTEVAYSVGLEWVISSNGNKVEYFVKDIEVINITDEFVGIVRYKDTAFGSTNNYFVAFSTDREIDKLMEADVSYEAETHQIVFMAFPVIKTDEILNSSPATAHLTYTDIDGNNPNGSCPGVKYTWNCIQTASEFLSSEQIEDNAKEKISNKQWVLRFLSAPYVRILIPSGSPLSYYYCTFVSDVSVLTLKFESNGVVYEMGVVNDKYTGSNIPVNTNQYDTVRDSDSKSYWRKFWNGVRKFFDDIYDFFKSLFDGSSSSWISWLIVIGVVLLILLILPITGPLIMSGIKLIAKGLLWLITSPIRLIRAILAHRSDK